MFKSSLLGSLALLALAGVYCLQPAVARDSQLPPAVSRVMNRLSVPEKNVSIYVRDASSEEVVLDLNADQLRSPASTMKVLTTFAALDMLGPTHTWKTRAYAAGHYANGILQGDLVLVGGGDPYMTSERWWSFVQGLRDTGLVQITGDVVIDNTFFAPTSGNRAEFDAQPYRSYNVLPDALLVNFQTVRFTLTANGQHSHPAVAISPLPANLTVHNEVRIAAGKCAGEDRGVSFAEAPESNTITLSGILGGDCGPYSVNRAIMNAPDYAYGTFRTLWSQSGGVIGGATRLAAVPSGAELLYEFDSIALSEVVRLVNKFSNNVMARHLLLTMGAEKFGAPATTQNGRNAVRAWLQARHIEIPGLALENGSGLSRTERITAAGLGGVLDAAWHSPFMPEFATSLPLAALDGTLRKRFTSAGMQGRLRLKTGRLDDVSALAGFINAASGKTYIMVIIVNHRGAHTGIGEVIQAELVRWVFAR